MKFVSPKTFQASFRWALQDHPQREKQVPAPRPSARRRRLHGHHLTPVDVLDSGWTSSVCHDSPMTVNKKKKPFVPIFGSKGCTQFLGPRTAIQTVSRGLTTISSDGRSSGSPARRAAFPPRLAARQWPFLLLRPNRVPRAGSAARRDYSGGTASDLNGIPCSAFRHRQPFPLGETRGLVNLS